MTDDAREPRLIELWTRLAERMRDRDAAKFQWLQSRIVQPFTSKQESKPIAWIDQANALADWLANSTKRLPASGISSDDLQKLQVHSNDLLRRIDSEQQADRSRFLGLLSPAKDLQELLDDLHSYLEHCQAVLAAIEQVAPLFEAQNEIAEIERQIDDCIAQMPASWPPIRLARFQMLLRERIGDFLPHLRKVADRSHAEWRIALAETGLPEEAREALILLRGLIECLAEVPAAHSELAILARELLTPFRMQAEIIRDPKQPAEWFESPIAADVAEPKVERIGLALRRLDGEWFCFPKGRLIVPIPEVVLPAPDIDGYAELESQAAAAGHYLAERLRQWREAALHGTLETTAVQFHVDWWGELGEELRQRDAELAAQIANRLQFVLQHGFKLFAFSPAAYQDYPDGWVQRVGGRAMVTGRVRRVIRPGLHDDQDHLRVPALVEVE